MSNTALVQEQSAIHQLFAAKALRAGQYALDVLRQHAADPRPLTARRAMLLQALGSVCMYANAPALAIEIAARLHTPMLHAGLWLEWDAYLLHVLDLARQSGDLPGQFTLWAALGDVRALRGETQAALQPLEAAMALVEHSRGDWSTPFCRYAECQMELSQFNDAERTLLRTVELARQRDDRLSLGNAWGQLGRICLPYGDFERARQYFQEALGIAIEVNNQANVLFNLNFLGMVHIELGQTEEALAYLADTLALCSQRAELSGQGVVLCNVGSAHLKACNLRAARCALREAAAIHRATAHSLKLAVALLFLGQVAVQSGEFASAAGYLAESMVLSRRAANKTLCGRAARAIGDYYAARGKQEAARLAYRRGRAWLLEAGQTYRASQVPACYP